MVWIHNITGLLRQIFKTVTMYCHIAAFTSPLSDFPDESILCLLADFIVLGIAHQSCKQTRQVYQVSSDHHFDSFWYNNFLGHNILLFFGYNPFLLQLMLRQRLINPHPRSLLMLQNNPPGFRHGG